MLPLGASGWSRACPCQQSFCLSRAARATLSKVWVAPYPPNFGAPLAWMNTPAAVADFSKCSKFARMTCSATQGSMAVASAQLLGHMLFITPRPTWSLGVVLTRPHQSSRWHFEHTAGRPSSCSMRDAYQQRCKGTSLLRGSASSAARSSHRIRSTAGYRRALPLSAVVLCRQRIRLGGCA